MAPDPLSCQERPVAANSPQVRYAPPTSPPRHREPSERRLRQAEAIHAIGIQPLAILLDELGGAPDAERRIEEFASAARCLVQLVMAEPEGSA
jgi:hypothetical protein